MYTVTMTFDVPETRKIDIESIKKEIYDFFNVLISREEKVSKPAHKSWTDQFRGKWQDDYMTAEEFMNEIRRNRDSNTREIVEL